MFSLVLSLLDFQGDHRIGIQFRVGSVSENKWWEVGRVNAGLEISEEFLLNVCGMKH